MNDIMDDLSCYLGCAFERDKMEGVTIMTQTASVDSLIDRFDIQYETQTPASVEFDLGSKTIHVKEGDCLTSRQLVVCCRYRG